MPGVPHGPRRRRDRRSTRSRLLSLLALAFVAGACGQAPAPSTGNPTREASPGPSAPTAATTPSAISTSEPPPSALPNRTVTPLATIPVRGGVHGLVAAPDAIWALGDGLTRIDPTSNTTGKMLPTNVEILEYGFGSLWLPDFDGNLVTRLDPRTGRAVASVSVVNPSSVLATTQGVWVSEHRSGDVALIDPASNTVKTKVVVGTKGPSGPSTARLIDGLIWVVIPRDSEIVAIDPKTATVVKKVEKMVGACGDIGAAVGALWVSQCIAGRIVDSVDETTGVVAQTFIGGYVGTPIPAADGIWLPVTQPIVAGPQDGLLLKLSRARTPVDAIDLGGACRPANDLLSAVEAFGSVWIGCPGGPVLRLAPTDLP